jgi:hypothetical protein
MLGVEKMRIVENLIVIDHGHGLASDKGENVLLELARHHMKRVFVRWGLPLLNPVKIDKHGLHTVVLRIDP